MRRRGVPALAAGFLMIALIPSVSSVAATGAARGVWISTGSMTAARADTVLTRLPSGKVLAVSGRGFNGIPIFTADLYDPSSGAWTATGPMAIDRYGAAVVLLPTGKVLAAGGDSLTIGANVATAELYDPATNTWTATGTMSAARSGGGVLLPNAKVLLAGGCGGGGGLSCSPVLSSAELYHPKTGTWTATGSLVTARFGNTMTLLPNGAVLVAGGCVATDSSGACTTLTSSAELYNPGTGTWTATGAMATMRFGATATLLKTGKVLVAGGCSSLPYVYGCSTSLSSAELYDPTTGAWTATGSMTTARDSHTATLLPNGEVLAAGGNANCCPGPANDTAELYNPSTGTWTPTAALHTARADQGAALLKDGQVLVAGGETTPGTSNTELASAEIYRLRR